MTPVERETAAFEIMQEAFEKLMKSSMDIRFRLQAEGHDYATEDVQAIQALIREGWEMFHEMWTMGS